MTPSHEIAVQGSGQHIYAKLKKVLVGDKLVLRALIPAFEDRVQATCISASADCWELELSYMDVPLGVLEIREKHGLLSALLLEAA